jgi:hypothetical protein
MTVTKYRIKVINETIVDEVSLDEAKQIADMLEMRHATHSFLGKISFTYSEIEKVI